MLPKITATKTDIQSTIAVYLNVSLILNQLTLFISNRTSRRKFKLFFIFGLTLIFILKRPQGAFLLFNNRKNISPRQDTLCCFIIRTFNYKLLYIQVFDFFSISLDKLFSGQNFCTHQGVKNVASCLEASAP
jgi:hypothetical protein